MATPSGTISLSDVNTELGNSPTALINMNEATVRTLAGVPSGAISMQNLQNKSNRVTSNITIASDTTNYTLNTAKVTGYSAGKTDVTLTINPGVNVYSTSTGSYALTVDTSWAVGDTVTIVNNGVIVGRGGNGGKGASEASPQATGPGTPAGPALLVQRAITLNNVNRIAGGGGGGGGGGMGYVPQGKGTANTGGGGGGGGVATGTGGAGGYTYPGPAGSPGATAPVSAPGSGGSGGTNAGRGGNGGAYGSGGSAGASGLPGAPAPSPQGGKPGGSAGACIVGNSNITYINTGTRNGSIS